MEDEIVRYTLARNAYQTFKDMVEVLKKDIIAKVQPELDAIDAQFADELLSKRADYEEIEKQIRGDVLKAGQSFKGDYWHFVYSKGPVTWNTQALEGYCKAHPELLEYRKEGKPSVAVKPSKGQTE